MSMHEIAEQLIRSFDESAQHLQMQAASGSSAAT